MTNDRKITIVASALGSSRGATVVGQVVPKEAIVSIKLPTNSIVTVKVDTDGNFIMKLPVDITVGSVKVMAVLPDDDTIATSIEAKIKPPVPVVTGVISTRAGRRYLEGHVSQHNVKVEVFVRPENSTIEAVINDQNEFEMEIPFDIHPNDLVVTATNRITGEIGTADITIGVTTETTMVPILTAEMIADYNKQSSNFGSKQLVGKETSDESNPDKAEINHTDESQSIIRNQEKGNIIVRFFKKLFFKKN